MLSRRLRLDVDSRERRWDVGDLAVKPERGMALGAVGLDRLHLVRCPVILQAATHEQLVKPLEPAQASIVHQVHELRVDRTVPDRRLPAQVVSRVLPLPDPHSAGRKDGKGQDPVIDLDQIHPVAATASKRSFGHAPRRRGRAAELGSRDREGVDPMIARDVRQRERGHVYEHPMLLPQLKQR